MKTLLLDDSLEIRKEATLLIKDIIPYIDRDLDVHMKTVLPNVVTNIGSKDFKLQAASCDLLKTYVPATRERQNLIDIFVLYGLKNSRRSEKINILNHLPKLIHKDLFGVDFSSLVGALASELSIKDVKIASLESLKKIRSVVGKDKFEGIVKGLQSDDRTRLQKNFEVEDDPDMPASHSEVEEEDDMDVVMVVKGGQERKVEDKNGSRRSSKGWVEFGVVDQTILEKMKNEVSKIVIILNWYI